MSEQSEARIADEETCRRFAEVCRLTQERLVSMTEAERDRMLQQNLAEARPNEPRRRTIRLIFEHGLDFIRQDGDTWSLTTSDDSVTSPHRVKRETGLRPIIAWVTDGGGKARPYVLPLECDLIEIDNAPRCVTQIFSDDGPKLFPAWNYVYHIRGIAYRLMTLATTYAWRSRRLHADQSEVACFDGAQEVAFEAEACISATIRLVDVLREPYRRRFGVSSGFDGRQGWKKLLKETTVTPGPLVQQIRDAWNDREIGIKTLNEYRNVIEHRRPLSGRSPFTEKLRFPGVGTGCSLWIPDDPLKKDDKQFTSAQRKDVLTYCWKASVRVVEIAREILTAVSEYPSSYPYPDEM